MIPSNLNHTVLSDDVTVLSTNPNEIGHGPNFYDGLAERTAAAMAYDLAKDKDSTVSDAALMSVPLPSPTSALILGFDPYGTTYVVAMVSTIMFSIVYFNNICRHNMHVHQLLMVRILIRQ